MALLLKVTILYVCDLFTILFYSCLYSTYYNCVFLKTNYFSILICFTIATRKYVADLLLASFIFICQIDSINCVKKDLNV